MQAICDREPSVPTKCDDDRSSNEKVFVRIGLGLRRVGKEGLISCKTV